MYLLPSPPFLWPWFPTIQNLFFGGQILELGTATMWFMEHVMSRATRRIAHGESEVRKSFLPSLTSFMPMIEQKNRRLFLPNMRMCDYFQPSCKTTSTRECNMQAQDNQDFKRENPPGEQYAGVKKERRDNPWQTRIGQKICQQNESGFSNTHSINPSHDSGYPWASTGLTMQVSALYSPVNVSLIRSWIGAFWPMSAKVEALVKINDSRIDPMWAVGQPGWVYRWCSCHSSL